MVQLHARHRRRNNTPNRNTRPSYDEPYDPHYHPHALYPFRGGSQFVLLIAGICIGYLILPSVLVNNNKSIALEEVVMRLEERQRENDAFKYVARDEPSSPLTMMREHSLNVVDERRRAAGPESTDDAGGSGGSLRGDARGGSDDETESKVEVERKETKSGDEDDETESGEGPDEGSEEAEVLAKPTQPELDAAEEEEPVQAEPAPVAEDEEESNAQLSQILSADKQSREAEEHDFTEAQKRFVETQKLIASQSIPTATTPHVMKTPSLPDAQRKKILVTGGAGFVGSHLVDKLMMEGHEVIVLDNFFTGQRKNIEHWMHHPHFTLVVHDVTEAIMLEVDEIYHLACPASPPHYQYNPVKTIKTSTMGTINMLGLAKRVRAKMLLTSTSEIYGDPKVHPQPESYWGNVNTIGPRACYDEGKRVAETMMYSYKNQNNIDVRVARIFNTFGPRMHPNDGRVVSNFIIQSLQDKPMTIYGDGSQTRSFQYVADLVDGLHALMNGKYDLPVNLGNPDEYTVKHFAEYIKDVTGSKSEISFLKATQDDPTQRKPDISTAKRELDWEPKVTVKEGLQKTIAYFSRVLDEAGEIIPTGQDASKPKPKVAEVSV